MTDRIKSLTVVLENNLRSDDAEPILEAIRMIRGVVSVDAHVADLEHHAARQQVLQEITSKVLDALKG